MDDSPLQRLPGELRNRIYELALWEADGVLIILHGKRAQAVRDNIGSEVGAVPLIKGLPTTSKALRAECLQLYFSINTFTFQTMHFQIEAARWPKLLRRWGQQIGRDQFRQIENVKIDLGTWPCSTSLTPVGLHKGRTSVIGRLFSPGARIQVQFRANFRFPGVDLLDISFPLGNPSEALSIVNGEVKEIQRRIQSTINNPLRQISYLEVFSLGYRTLVDLIEGMMDG